MAKTTTEQHKPNTSPITVEQIEMLKNLFSQIRTEPPAPTASSSAHVAQRGNSFLSKQENSASWIVDSGASDHMTGSADLFSSYKPCDGEIKITVADGSSSLVAGFGDLNLCGLSLKSVLYVPNLKYNLISVSKLSKDQICAIIFSFTSCEFQDLALGMMIGNAEFSIICFVLLQNLKHNQSFPYLLFQILM